LEDARWRDTLDQSRQIPLLSEPEAAEAAGVTYNQFDDWVQRGWLVPAGRRGRQRSFGAGEIVRANWLRSIAATPAKLDEVIKVIRVCDLSARYLAERDWRDDY
jgi:hypothetical protein